MKYKARYKIFYSLFFLIVFFSCKNVETCSLDRNLMINEDSAFLYIKKQVEFGPRVPNTQAHNECVQYLANKLESFGANVIIQQALVNRFDGLPLDISNIIAEFYPEKERRILFFAHYDTRYFADMEKEPQEQNKPISGANDGASGVGVLLEIARQISQNEPNVGVDIIFFDAEDQGQPLYMDVYDEKAWALGAQYWSLNKHKPDYDALFGVAVDMVGYSDAVFSKEDNSRYFNNFLVKKVWTIADSLGYSNYFPEKYSNPVLHDHVFVSQIAGIRSILILDNIRSKEIPFFDNWHTHKDTIENIDKNTLKVVGNVLLQLIYCTE